MESGGQFGTDVRSSDPPLLTPLFATLLSLKLIADEFGVTIDSLVSDEDMQPKREIEDKQSLRLYFAAVVCAIAAIVAAAIGMGGMVDLPPTARIVCR